MFSFIVPFPHTHKLNIRHTFSQLFPIHTRDTESWTNTWQKPQLSLLNHKIIQDLVPCHPFFWTIRLIAIEMYLQFLHAVWNQQVLFYRMSGLIMNTLWKVVYNYIQAYWKQSEFMPGVEPSEKFFLLDHKPRLTWIIPPTILKIIKRTSQSFFICRVKVLWECMYMIQRYKILKHNSFRVFIVYFFYLMTKENPNIVILWS